MNNINLKALGLIVLLGNIIVIGLCLSVAGIKVLLQCITFILSALVPLGIGSFFAFRYDSNERVRTWIICITGWTIGFSLSLVGIFMDPKSVNFTTGYKLLVSMIIGFVFFVFTWFITYILPVSLKSVSTLVSNQ